MLTQASMSVWGAPMPFFCSVFVSTVDTLCLHGHRSFRAGRGPRHIKSMAIQKYYWAV